MTLTHNGGPGWAKPAMDSAGRWVLGGLAGCAPSAPSADDRPALSRFGAAVVREMERLGILRAAQLERINASRGAATHENHGMMALGGADPEEADTRSLVRGTALSSDDPRNTSDLL